MPGRRPDPAPRQVPTRRERIAQAVARLAPRLPAFEAEAILDRALASPGLRGAAPENAAWLGMVAYARHVFTEYDALLAEGYDQDSARHFVLDDLNAVLAGWGVRRRIGEEAEEA
ncbi:conserved hypothetical proteinn [Methylobacterium sp. 4-46]|uniref:DUF2293 domain-containing protein n=1 Tax=unclassified Methylobacterium TaxID=2615210 RepID=UPI000165C875|nr:MULTISPECIES: DUF2293 domain-containing protein [Methylobacterium]ACA15048.1 conserved hypothetical proteinn [Methylobacterium sp. 4-46]WFT80786.1 DUF2293 domain-containing protein [Methylobacterium nodulans]